MHLILLPQILMSLLELAHRGPCLARWGHELAWVLGLALVVLLRLEAVVISSEHVFVMTFVNNTDVVGEVNNK